ncbi:MAG: ATP cone domain-containing protein [Clostridiales bacterium]
MIVLKRDGSTQEFNEDKIRASLETTSDEIGEPMSSGNIRIIVKGIVDRISRYYTDQVHAKDIHYFVVAELANSGYYNVAKAYNESVRSLIRR